MFKTYRERLLEIEQFYEKKDYEYVVVECAKVTEKAVGSLFKNFHLSLNNTSRRLKFLEFEKSNGDKYNSFLNKPTIGVGIGFYNSLFTYCKDHPWIKPELKSSLNIINTTRNNQVHAGKAVITDNEAGEVIDATERFLRGIELIDQPLEDVGFPLKYYLVYTSIKSKFEKGDTETDFKRIINDSNKLIPDLLNSVFNKVYPYLTIEDKQKLNKLHPKTISSDNKNDTLKSFIEIFEEINLFPKIPEGETLRNSLIKINGELKDSYSRRTVRHHVNTLDKIFHFIHNKKLDHFLNYANLLKKKYLEDNQINKTDRIILIDRAKELKISEQVADTIERTVVRTIEKELILFQTLHEDKLQEESTNKNKSATERQEKGMLGTTKKMALIISVSLLIVITLFIFLLNMDSSLTAYEKAHLESKHSSAIKFAGKVKSINDVKANYYYILSNYLKYDKIFPEHVEEEYRAILRNNPDSPEAHLYLGYIYSKYKWYYSRHKADSSWILIDKAFEMGLANEYAQLIQVELYKSNNLPSLAIKKVQDLLANNTNNPRILEVAANEHLNIAYDTLKAIELYQTIKNIYPKYLYYYCQLSKIAIDRQDFNKAHELLTEAQKINSNNVELVLIFSKLYMRQQKFEQQEECLMDAISGFGENNWLLYSQLSYYYRLHDKIDEGVEFTKEALLKFPNNSELIYSLNRLTNAQLLNEQNTIKAEINEKFNWSNDFENALVRCKSEKKPILLALVTEAGNAFVYNNFFKSYLEDSNLFKEISNYIPVKIHYTYNSGIFKNFDINYPFYDLCVVSEDKKVLKDLTFEFRSSNEFRKLLEYSLAKYNRQQFGKSINANEYTQVHNFNDALTMATAKNQIIMVIAGSKENVSSQKLIDETVQDPVFQAEYKNLVYLYLEHDKNKDLLNTWKIKSFPTVLYFNKKGELLHKTNGYKPAGVLAEITANVKDAFYNNEQFVSDLNWIYDLKEAETLAMTDKKYIFAANKQFLERNELLSEKVILWLKQNYICVNLNEIDYKTKRSYFGFNIWYSSIAILNQSGKLLFRYTNPTESYKLLSWLNIEDKLNTVAILGREKYEQYTDKIMLAKQLYDYDLYGSAINVYKEAIELYPENSENYLAVGNAYLNWLKAGESIPYFDLAVEKGSLLDHSLVKSIINAHLQIMDQENLIKWLNSMIKTYQEDKVSLSRLYYQGSVLYEILQDTAKTTHFANKALEADPENLINQSRMGELLYKFGKVSEAKRYLKQALKINNSDVVSLFYLGLCYESEGSINERDKYFGIAIQNEPNMSRYLWKMDYWEYVNYYRYPGYIKLIEQGFLNTIKINSEEALSYNNLAYLYAIEGIHLERAMELVDKSLENDPENWATLDTKAWILYMMGQYNEASVLMNKTIELSPKETINIETWYHLGMIDLALGDTVKAIEALKKAYYSSEPSADGMRIKEDIESKLGEIITL